VALSSSQAHPGGGGGEQRVRGAVDDELARVAGDHHELVVGFGQGGVVVDRSADHDRSGKAGQQLTLDVAVGVRVVPVGAGAARRQGDVALVLLAGQQVGERPVGVRSDRQAVQVQAGVGVGGVAEAQPNALAFCQAQHRPGDRALVRQAGAEGGCGQRGGLDAVRVGLQRQHGQGRQRARRLPVGAGAAGQQCTQPAGAADQQRPADEQLPPGQP
jgi:hypothetical protein